MFIVALFTTKIWKQPAAAAAAKSRQSCPTLCDPICNGNQKNIHITKRNVYKVEVPSVNSPTLPSGRREGPAAMMVEACCVH